MRDQVISRHHSKNYRKLVNIASKRLNHQSFLAEEAVQEAYARALKYYELTDVESFDGWFVAIFNNAVRDAYAREFSIIETDDIDNTLIDKGTFECEYLLTKKFLEDEINDYPNPKHRQVLQYYYIFGFDYSDIHELVEDITLLAMRKLIQRFTEQMGEKYG